SVRHKRQAAQRNPKPQKILNTQLIRSALGKSVPEGCQAQRTDEVHIATEKGHFVGGINGGWFGGWVASAPAAATRTSRADPRGGPPIRPPPLTSTQPRKCVSYP